MKKYEVKRFDMVAIDVKSLCEEVEKFLNEQGVELTQTFTTGRWLIVIFKTDKDKEV